MRYRFLTTFCGLLLLATAVYTQSKSKPSDKFRQLEENLPTPTEYRAASGAPGHKYWQQRADYAIEVELDDTNQRIVGKETVTYYNNSPDTLTYLWLQLDQNIWDKNSDTAKTQTSGPLTQLPLRAVENIINNQNFDGGHKITSVRDATGKPLRYSVVKTMMRIDLPTPLATGQTVKFAIDWNYNINDQRRLGGRTGYEYFPADGNYLYEIAQWFPRLAAYTDVNGWHLRSLNQF